MQKRILLSSPHMSRQGWEKHYVKQAFEKNWIAPMGENVDAFEDEIKNYVGRKHAVAVSSGTAAIHLALRTLNVQAGDVVLCSTLTFAASANPICYVGATPVFIDSEADTWNMDPQELEHALRTQKNVKAVIVVHLYGIPAKMAEIMEICRRFNVPVIEDAAESLGSTYRNQQTGTFGDIGIYSFNGNKIITTSGGGMLVTDNRKIAEKAKYLATQARENVLHYEHVSVGYNYRMSNICAGIGRGQLKVLDERIQKKREIFQAYKAQLADISCIEWMPEPENCFTNQWLSCMTVKGINPFDIIESLDEANIESRPIWKPMHRQPVFARERIYGGKQSDHLFSHGVCLPSDTKMRDSDIDRVVTTLRESIRNVSYVLRERSV